MVGNESGEKQVGAKHPLRRFTLWLLLAGAALLISADVFIGVTVYRQWQTIGWFKTEGVIESSRITERRDGSSNRILYSVEVKYRYEVEGQTYIGERWRYGGSMESNRRSVFPQYSPGERVEVYYDPDEPSEAVLMSGLTDLDRAFLLFVSQLNLPIVLFLVAMVVWKKRRSSAVPVRHVGSRDQVRVTSFTPLAGAMLGVTIGAVASILSGWLFWGTDPRTTGYLSMVSPSLGLAVAAMTYFALRAGVGCVVYDADVDALNFATQVGTTQKRVTVPRSQVISVGRVEEISPFNSTWRLVIRARSDDEERREMSAGRWGRSDDAAAVVDWLAQRLMVPRQDAEARPFRPDANTA